MFDKRTFRRFRKQSTIRWNQEEVRFEGITQDICPGGVFIITGTASVLPPRSIIEIELWIGDEDHPLLSLGEVVWANHGQLVNYPPGFGVKFLNLKRELQERLIRLCEEIEEE
ncbi:MAG TPA: PilZ domain-containing protein [Syntrophobacteraceae bacterium]|nr:PilZ domain-containing protein [Syntrophobacteraceae bacterium]